MMKQAWILVAVLSLVLWASGCGKQLVSFESLEEPELSVAFDVQGPKAVALKTGLQKLDFVQLVQDASADRVLTGSSSTTGFDLALANPDGSTILGVKEASVEACVQKLQPALMNIYVLKTLSRARTQNQPFKIEVKTDRDPGDPYRATEFIQFRVKSEEPCYLVLLELAPNGKINILYPNAYSAQQQIEANKWYMVPEEESPFQIQIDPYAGQAVVWAVGHEETPLDLTNMTGQSVEDAEGYITLSHPDSAAFLRKLFPVVFPSRAVVVGDPWATGYTVYRVE